jgi:hypothetical protein
LGKINEIPIRVGEMFHDICDYRPIHLSSLVEIGFVDQDKGNCGCGERNNPSHART